MHQLERIRSQVERTHPGLGQLSAALALATKARLCTLIIAPAGCGKSAAMKAIASAIPPGDCEWLDSVTRAGLRPFQGRFTNFGGLVCLDDLGKIDTYYSRIATLTTFAELCYTGYVAKHTWQVHVEISGFKGATLIGCQPVVLRAIYRSGEWEATLQDKTLRFYHLYRPKEPQPFWPRLRIPWGPALDKVQLEKPLEPWWRELRRLGLAQWSQARSQEHMAKLLKAAAALDGRDTVQEIDYRILLDYLRPMLVERAVVTKEGWEEKRDLNPAILCLMVQFASYGSFTIEQIMDD